MTATTETAFTTEFAEDAQMGKAKSKDIPFDNGLGCGFVLLLLALMLLFL